MLKTLSTVVVALFCIANLSCVSDRNQNMVRAESVLVKAAGYLWSKQAGDGGWHSETHGILRGGQAWTPFALLALADMPLNVTRGRDADLEHGLAFIRAHVNEEGAIGLSDPDVLEYPNYATSFALRLMAEHAPESDRPLADRMRAYLISQQLTERRGFTEDDLVFGSWGFGETNLPPGTPGFADLSHTRRVLQALRETGTTDSSIYKKSESFLRLLQKHPADTRIQPGEGNPVGIQYDGGFYFSPVVVARNKGGMEDSGVFRSYATATCDGVLALYFAGIPQSDERVASALSWLSSHPMLEQPEGIPEDYPEQWQDVMFFYHLLVRSEVYATFGSEGNWRNEMVALLEKRQKADGSFANPFGELNKEDDPILATAMVVYTLTNILR